MEAPKLKLKLFIDTKSNKVLFAEAGKDFVDFIFYFISLPVSTVVRLLQEIPVAYALQSRCTNCRNFFSAEITDVVSHVASSKSNDDDSVGFVKSLVTYMLMDNLEVTGNSAISLLKKFNVKDVDRVEERVVEFGPNEVQKLIKASVECKAVLTSVFLVNKGAEILKEEENIKNRHGSSQVKLKLLIDTNSKNVLFAEAGKDFVDFLFYLLSLPVATVTKLLKKKGDVGCLTDLYKSLENLNKTYMQPNQNKTSLLNPKSPLYANGIPLLLSDQHHQVPTSRKVYQCQYNLSHLADVPNFCCTLCGHCMTKELTLLNSSAPANTGTKTVVEEGFVKGVVTYMVMDNLVVKPMSTISSITLLNEFSVKDVGSLEEKEVVLGVDEGLKLLKASLECKNVLTTVFLGNIGVEEEAERQ
ncbi:hypothetical protein EZV62_025565 [Acer yangbiense]|uniref:DUF674 domain-containing protein n=1 Tax=Acer yangbiense TaxID=1000413 RepID=A0A5C7GY84_9ROSI|nr:hypothetical protein EZV62_025565 [Acer yangbiense]